MTLDDKEKIIKMVKACPLCGEIKLTMHFYENDMEIICNCGLHIICWK